MSTEAVIEHTETAVNVEDMGVPYKMASTKNWQGFKQFYASDTEALFRPVTINGDNAFHIAAASSDNPQLLQHLLSMVSDRERHEALKSVDHQGNTPLLKVAMTDNVLAAKSILFDTFNYKRNEDIQQLDEILRARNRLGETALYRAAAVGKMKMVRYLAQVIELIGSSISHDNAHFLEHLRYHFHRKADGISILHMAVLGQHFDTALWLLKRDTKLANEKIIDQNKNEDLSNLTCLHLLALMPDAFRSTNPMSKFKTFIYSCLPDYSDDEIDDEADLIPLIGEEDLETGKNDSGNRQQGKKQIAANSVGGQVTQNGAISKMWIALCRLLIRGWPAINRIWKEKKKHNSATELVTLLVETDRSWKHCTNSVDLNTIALGIGKGKRRKESSKTNDDLTLPSKSFMSEIPLVFAVCTGVTEIFEAITNRYPQAIDYVTEAGQNVLHLAIMLRQKPIFDRIKEMQMALPRLASRIDDTKGNTILHYVADMTSYPGGTRPGPALQFQEELEWFRDVQDLMQPHCRMHRNKEGDVASSLFEKNHEEQHKKAQEWMKDTSQSCSTVAILVATVVFAAAYTVPGGINSENGLPTLLNTPLFKLFAVMDVVSLGSSLTSVVMFLSILTSPFQQRDFLYSLPRKLTIGFSFLFFSVLTTMVTFTASILLTVRLGKRWTASLVYTAAFIPVMIFAVMMFPWYAAFVTTTIDFFQQIRKLLPGNKKQE